MAEAASVCSKSSATYRTLAKTSQVDESLFSSKKSNTKKTAQGSNGALKSATERTGPAIVSLSKDQLHRMLKPSPVLTLSQANALKLEAQETRDAERAHSNARKARMLAMEEERKKQVPPTETELLRQQADAKIRSRAEEILLEQQDEAKAMNRMVNYCKCVTIRDAQLAERKYMMLEEEEETRRLDAMMEAERLKALRIYEEREVQRKYERIKGAQVLQEQLEERQRERIREEEQQERERLIMLKEMERLREQELRQQVEKQQRAKELIAEVMDANKEQVERKKDMQAREVAEDARIADYNRRKQLREAAVAEEKARIAREKELECARLRAAQEKAADKQSELDELRARRHAEAAEREWRAKEAAKAARNQAILDDLHSSRQAQKAAKLVQQAEMAKREKSEFEQIIKVNQVKEAQDAKLHSQVCQCSVWSIFLESFLMTLGTAFTDRSLKAATMLYTEAHLVQIQELKKQNQAEVLAQISANKEKKQLERVMVLEEGTKVVKKADQYMAQVEAIKQKKLNELKKAGVPAKYCAELMKYEVGSSGK
eukprot:jgi/Ulvmu1/10841/UM007_0015.1